ncbi:hypothetical protein, partial [Rhodoblastus acidophilus]
MDASSSVDMGQNLILKASGANAQAARPDGPWPPVVGEDGSGPGDHRIGFREDVCDRSRAEAFVVAGFGEEIILELIENGALGFVGVGSFFVTERRVEAVAGGVKVDEDIARVVGPMAKLEFVRIGADKGGAVDWAAHEDFVP